MTDTNKEAVERQAVEQLTAAVAFEAVNSEIDRALAGQINVTLRALLARVDALTINEHVLADTVSWQQTLVDALTKERDDLQSRIGIANHNLDNAVATIMRQRQLLESADSIFKECEVSTGFCVCGDKAEHHDMGSGHSPVDAGGHAVMRWQEEYNKEGKNG